jgi:hypothetical protein
LKPAECLLGIHTCNQMPPPPTWNESLLHVTCTCIVCKFSELKPFLFSSLRWVQCPKRHPVGCIHLCMNSMEILFMPPNISWRGHYVMASASAHLRSFKMAAILDLLSVDYLTQSTGFQCHRCPSSRYKLRILPC